MSFLAPLFLLGGLAIGLPVLFHLIRRTTREKTIFSSLMFLAPSPPRLTRRSRLEHILLLALRCAVLCLLALGFARPFLKKAMPVDPPSTAQRRVVVLVDSSASMRRAGLWAAARDKAESVIGKLGPADQAAVLTFDRQVNELVSFEEWNRAPAGERSALAVRKLEENSPGWAGTHVANALIRAAELIAEPGDDGPNALRQIVLISDLQEGSRLEQLQGYEWPKGVQLLVEPLKPANRNNAAIQLVTDSEDSATKDNQAIRVRVSNVAESKREQFKVGWTSGEGRAFVGQPIDIYVPAGQTRIVSLAATNTGPADRVSLQGDDEAFDNSIFVVPPETVRSTVVYLGNDSEKDPRQPLYFLQRAFQETARRTVRVRVVTSASPIAAADAQAANLFVIVDSVADEQARALHELIKSGKTALVLARNESMASTLAALLGAERIGMQETRPTSYAMLADIDFRHPLFAPFADPRFSDFTRIHFWKYRRVELGSVPGARVIASFDSGDPALLDVPAGKGHVILLTSGWQPEDSQLALSTKFVPMLYALFELTDSANALPAQYQVGDSVALASLSEAGKSEVQIKLPDGSSVTLQAGESGFSQTRLPGIYEIGPGVPARRFVVNLDPAESRTVPLALDELERLGAPVPQQAAAGPVVAGAKVRLHDAELENRQKLWRWLIMAAVLIVLVETWLAGRTARAPAREAGISAPQVL